MKEIAKPTLIPEELVSSTPSGSRKLLAAWNGLSIESQIQALLYLSKTFSPHWRREVSSLAFKSRNAYIRYLAYRDFRFDRDDQEHAMIQTAIRDDEHPLVRSVLLERDFYWSFDLDPERFWGLPHDDRLAIARTVRGRGKEMAALLTFGALEKTAQVPLLEVREVLADYINSGSFRSDFIAPDLEAKYDGMFMYGLGEDLKALWQIVPVVPDPLAFALVAVLPVESGMLRSVPQEVVSKLTDHQLRELLWRRDAPLEELRKRLFFDEQTNDDVVEAAVSSNFRLSNIEFQGVEKFALSGNIRRLELLGEGATGLSMAQYSALESFVQEIKDCKCLTQLHVNRQRASAALASPEEIERTLHELRLLELARVLIRHEVLDERLGEFEICRGETGVWKSFLCAERIYKSSPRRSLLRSALPEVWNEWDSTSDKALQSDPIPHQKDAGAVDVEVLHREIMNLALTSNRTKAAVLLLLLINALLALKLLL